MYIRPFTTVSPFVYLMHAKGTAKLYDILMQSHELSFVICEFYVTNIILWLSKSVAAPYIFAFRCHPCVRHLHIAKS